jgi:hypothetical protein
LNKVIKGDTFETPSVGRTIEVIGRDKKYYCCIDLRQGYHHISLRGKDRIKITFGTGRVTGRLQYHLLLYRYKHREQVFNKAIQHVLSGQ